VIEVVDVSLAGFQNLRLVMLNASFFELRLARTIFLVIFLLEFMNRARFVDAQDVDALLIGEFSSSPKYV